MADRSNLRVASNDFVRAYEDYLDALMHHFRALGIPEAAIAKSTEDEAWIRQAMGRYLGRMDKLDFNESGTRAQLAFDLGCVMGMCARLVAERHRG